MVKDSLVTVVITNDAHISESGIFELICEKIRISVCVLFFFSTVFCECDVCGCIVDSSVWDVGEIVVDSICTNVVNVYLLRY